MKKNSAEAYVINAVEEAISLFRYIYSHYKMSSCTNCADDILDIVRNNSTALSCLASLKTYDKYTFSHSINVFFLSKIIGSVLGFNKNQLLDAGMSALFHDIGKTLIPKRIVNKRTMLTEVEFAIIKTHPSKGYFYVKENIDLPEISFLGILHHHEKYDGTGYPIGVRKDEIDILGRVIAIADAYDAITSCRPYREAKTHTEAMEFIHHNSGIHFDPEIVAVFSTEVVSKLNL